MTDNRIDFTICLFSKYMNSRVALNSEVRYCCPVWGSCGSTAINELQKLQNRAARIVTNSRYDASAKPIIKKL